MILWNEVIKNLEDLGKLELPYMPPGTIVAELEILGWERSEFDTNGWQWDYWITMSKGPVNIQISGCGYYGDSVELELL